MVFDSYRPAAPALQEVIFEKHSQHKTSWIGRKFYYMLSKRWLSDKVYREGPFDATRSGTLVQLPDVCSLVDAAESGKLVPASGSRLLES